MSKLERRNTLIAYSFILPNFLGFLCFTLIPVLFSFILSFMQWDSANPIKFVGLDNFAKMFNDETFKISFANTLYYTAGTVILTLIASLILALILNKNIKGRVIFRAIFFFPYVASLIAVAVVWNMLFHPDMGPVNSLLVSLGISNPPRWSASVEWAMPTVIGLSVWKGMGYYMIVYLAALQGIPSELYEAAVIDGANSWQQFRYVTLPMLTPTTFFVVMMLVISSFKVFDTIYIMTQGGPGRATNVLVYHIYNTAFIRFEFGYASAISVVLFLVVLAITLVQFRTEKKWVSYM
ncbi:MAG: sugar ABC transporter permease [Thermoanaerobacteraceae bacterium]|nr:sugar ABC transporter permease [Thermoanaerobacteraceae bacterium]